MTEIPSDTPSANLDRFCSDLNEVLQKVLFQAFSFKKLFGGYSIFLLLTCCKSCVTYFVEINFDCGSKSDCNNCNQSNRHGCDNVSSITFLRESDTDGELSVSRLSSAIFPPTFVGSNFICSSTQC